MVTGALDAGRELWFIDDSLHVTLCDKNLHINDPIQSSDSILSTLAASKVLGSGARVQTETPNRTFMYVQVDSQTNVLWVPQPTHPGSAHPPNPAAVPGPYGGAHSGMLYPQKQKPTLDPGGRPRDIGAGDSGVLFLQHNMGMFPQPLRPLGH